MVTYTATALVNRALSLADLQDTSFISYGDHFNYINDSYNIVYSDLITHADDAYVKDYYLSGSGIYNLPEDFYQLRSLTLPTGGMIPRLQLNDGPATFGYKIENNQLIIQGIGTSAVLKYYPLPATITFKNKEFSVDMPITPLSGYGSLVIDQYGSIYDISKEEFVVNKGTEAPLYDFIILGKYDYIAKEIGSSSLSRFNFNGDSLTNVVNPLLSETGEFISNTTQQKALTVGACDEGRKYCYYFDTDGYFVLNGEKLSDNIITGSHSLRYLFFDNKHCCVFDKDCIVYPDGSKDEITFSDADGVLLKMDISTGYGILVNKGGNYYVEGCFPETLIDYPNNLFFSYTAYQLAIAYRNKQSADTSNLISALDKISEQYFKTINTDDYSYPRIQNKDYVGVRY